MTIEALARKHRLAVTRDDGGEKIIRGRQGFLYMDGKELCAMWLGAKPIPLARLVPLGGKLWRGDISGTSFASGFVQDIRCTGIAPDAVPLAIALVGAKKTAGRIATPGGMPKAKVVRKE